MSCLNPRFKNLSLPALVLVGLLASCSTPTPGDPSTTGDNPAAQVNVTPPVDTLWAHDVPLNASTHTPLIFSNGDSIPYCGDKQAWLSAAQSQQPAWCYADSTQRSGVLYNFFALTDPRGIAANAALLSVPKAQAIAQQLAARGSALSSYFDAGWLRERSYLGNYYNLGYVNYWVVDSTAAAPACHALTIDVHTGTAQLAKPHPGNGYRLLFVQP